MRRNTSIAFSTALSPTQGVEPWAALPVTSMRMASTPLAWMPMCMLVGSPVMAKSPRSPARPGGRSRAARPPRTPRRRRRRSARARCSGCQVVQRAHHGREAALHVVGAAAVEAVPVDARRELLGAPGHHVEVAVSTIVGPPLGSDAGGQQRPAVVNRARHLHVTRLEPALHEAGGALHALQGGRVGEQALGERLLIHPRARIVPRSRPRPDPAPARWSFTRPHACIAA